MAVQDVIAELVKAGNAPIEKRAITNLGVLNEAYDYAKPSSFSRGMRIDLNGRCSILLISGTASIDEARRVACISATSARRCAVPTRTSPPCLSCRRRHLARHRAHYLLLARHRSRLRRVQRRAHSILQGARARSVAGVDGHRGEAVPS